MNITTDWESRARWAAVRSADLERTAQAAEARVAELEAFVASVREHILGECPGLTSADCVEAIRIDLHALEAKTSADSVSEEPSPVASREALLNLNERLSRRCSDLRARLWSERVRPEGFGMRCRECLSFWTAQTGEKHTDGCVLAFGAELAPSETGCAPPDCGCRDGTDPDEPADRGFICEHDPRGVSAPKRSTP